MISPARTFCAPNSFAIQVCSRKPSVNLYSDDLTSGADCQPTASATAHGEVDHPAPRVAGYLLRRKSKVVSAPNTSKSSAKAVSSTTMKFPHCHTRGEGGRTTIQCYWVSRIRTTKVVLIVTVAGESLAPVG